MKIAIDARTMGSRPSGVGMYLNDFLNQLIKYDDLEFYLLSDLAESEYIRNFEKMGIPVVTQGKKIYKSAGVYSYFSFVQRELNRIKPDIFWEVNTVIPVKLKGDFRIMITVHDMFPIEYVQYFGRVYSLYFKYGLSKTLKETDMILYNSRQTKLTTEEYFPVSRNIPNCNGYIIANPLKKNWENSDKDFFLYVGNMEKRKGVDLLLKGFQKYRQNGGTRNLVLAGKMQEDDIIIQLQEAMDKDSNITYLDYVTHDKKHELYASMSAFVFPSKAEGFGMPVIEVMKFNKPIIASNLPIFQEITDGSINTFDIDCSEAEQINNLAAALDGYNPYVDEAAYRDTVNRFSPQKLGKTVHDFIMEQKI